MSPEKSAIKHAEWAKAATIYEVNVRQFTPEGSFRAFATHLPRLKALGVDIVWLMPIQPIGRKNRKGALGSYYSVSDYLSVNPEFGTLDDFKQLVADTHAHGMRLIIDWVANHTAWDHPWVSQHPDWYKKNGQGEIHAYVHDNGHALEHWADVVGLDYRHPALWREMTEALAFWVRETGIDGYRCDVAGLLPTPFWEQARAELERIKPVFMLAEWQGAELHRKAFDASYDWDLYDVMTAIAAGRDDVNRLVDYIDRRQAEYPKDAWRMTFTSNHDKNSWEGDDVALYGAAFKLFAVLAVTLPGIPLIYGGQESVLDKRIAFFEKDAIDWKDYGLSAFYAQLLQLKHRHPCLWNGESGADLEVQPASTTQVFAFRRAQPGSAITVWANLSDRPQHVALGEGRESWSLAPWGYRIETD